MNGFNTLLFNLFNTFFLWCLQLGESLTLEYERMQTEEGLVVQIDSTRAPLSPSEFVEYWRTRIWVHGFSSLFRGKEAYSRSKAFDSFSYTSRILKRVLYRYLFIYLNHIDHPL